MGVYVDDMKAPYGRMVMCHMAADTREELHEMADKIGVKRKWFQGWDKASFPHYDICLAKKELAIKHGAKAVTGRELIGLIKDQRKCCPNPKIEGRDGTNWDPPYAWQRCKNCDAWWDLDLETKKYVRKEKECSKANGEAAST